MHGTSVEASTREADIRLESGIRLRYLEQGPQSGPAILMLHGYPDSSFSFSRVLPLLPPEFHVVVPDQRGWGLSDRPAGEYDLDTFARDAAQLLDGLGVPTATVVGHSFGSFVARRLAIQSPNRVERLVLIGTAPTARNPVTEALLEDVRRLQDPIDTEFARAFQASTIHLPVPPAFFERVVSDSLLAPARVWKAVLGGFIDAALDDGRIRCPTVLIGGAHDGVFSRGEQEQMAERIPGASIRIFDHVGHDLHWEDPALFIRELSR
jgi:pimeloyl-ACP methyl ester carboxylesterase